MSLLISSPLKAIGSVSPLNNVTTQYQGGQDFSSELNQAFAGTPGTNYQVSGSLKTSYIIATGAVGADGQVRNFSDQQIQNEMADAKSMSQTAYEDTLNSFLVLAQANQSSGSTGAFSTDINRGLDAADGLDGVSFGGTLTLTPTASGNQTSGTLTEKIKID